MGIFAGFMVMIGNDYYNINRSSKCSATIFFKVGSQNKYRQVANTPLPLSLSFTAYPTPTTGNGGIFIFRSCVLVGREKNLGAW